MQTIRDFYEPLGVEVTAVGLRFERFEILFVGDDVSREGFLVSVDVDGDLNDVEEHYRRKGIAVLDSGFDASGPCLVALDPTGLKVRIGLTSEGLSRLLK